MTLRYANNPSGPHWGGVLRGLALSVFLFTTLIFFNLLQALSVLVSPFSRSAFYAINRKLAGTWWGWGAWLAEGFYGVKFHVSGDEVPQNENVLVVSNHQQMPDIMCLMGLANRKGRIGDLKWFVKAPIRYVPGVGWGLSFLDCIFLKRNWADDQTNIKATFKRLVDNRVPFWLVSFSEGTRITDEKLKASHLYARTNGKKMTSHVLIPRTKGFVAAVQGLSQVLDAVYDVTIGYPHGIPTLRQWIRGWVPEVRLHVRRFPMSQLPTDPKELAEWLVWRFYEKDQLLVRLEEDGFFPALEWRSDGIGLPVPAPA